MNIIRNSELQTNEYEIQINCMWERDGVKNAMQFQKLKRKTYNEICAAAIFMCIAKVMSRMHRQMSTMTYINMNICMYKNNSNKKRISLSFGFVF